VVEHPGLDALVLSPPGGFGEDVDLDRQTGGAGCQLTDNEVHPLGVDLLVLFDVGFDVGAEDLDVGDLRSIQRGVVAAVLPAVGFDGCLPFGDVVADQVDAGVAGDHLGGAEVDGVLVERDGAHDAPPAALLHAAPVLVGHLDELVGGDDGDGLVPVLHLDGVQADVEDGAVGVVGGNLQPVTLAHQVLDRDLHAGDERHDGILEDQQQDGGQRPQPAQQQDGRLAGEERNADDDADHHQQDLEDVEVALDADPVEGRAGFVDLVEGVEKSEEGHQGDPEDEEEGRFFEDGLPARRQVSGQVEQDERRQQGGAIGAQFFDDDIVVLVPGAFGDGGQAAAEDQAGEQEGE